MLKYIFHPYIKLLLCFAIEMAGVHSLYIEESTLCSKSDERLGLWNWCVFNIN